MRKFGAATVAPLIKALVEGPQTAHTLSKLSGFSVVTCNAFCRSLHQANLIRIAAWRAHQTQNCPAYVFGSGADSVENWTPTQQKLFQLFKTTTASLSIPEMRDALRVNRNRLTPALDDLTEKGYLIEERKGKFRRWRVRPDVAFPQSRNRVRERAPAPVRQTWFSAIA